MKDEQAVLAVKFQSTHDPEILMNICQEDLNDFKNVPGLIRKYYLGEESTGALSGVYIFEDKDARKSFWESDLAKNIPVRYGVILDSLRVEEYTLAIEIK